MPSRLRPLIAVLGVVVLASALDERRLPAAGVDLPLDRDAQRWVIRTLQQLTLDEKIGQLLVAGIDSGFAPAGSPSFEAAAELVREYHVGGLIVFGTTDPSGAPALGQPLAVASTLNRLQGIPRVPLLVAADFEFGPGMRLAGATTFPRAMAFAAADEVTLLEEAARITAREARAIGIHVNLAPVADVNNNADNPVINTRAFGEGPAQVARFVSAYVRALQGGGVLATLKHFPGHGDTNADSHLGLPVLAHASDRLAQVELLPFRTGIGAGVAAVMTSHIALPLITGDAQTPATFSAAVATGLLRQELGFDGLVLTDSLKMAGLTSRASPREAAVRAVIAGHDLLVDVPDVEDAFFAIGAAIERGEISLDRLDESVTRILRAKARAGLHRQRVVSLDAIADVVGSRQGAALAANVAQRAVTLVRDDGDNAAMRVPADGSVLFLSVADSPDGWGSMPPGRVMRNGLRQRWPQLIAVDLTDRTPDAELDSMLASLSRYDAVVAAVFVRTISGSGRLHLPAALGRLMNAIGRQARMTGTPMAAVLFGNPYVAAALEEVPAVMLTYDWGDLPERAAIAALTGASPIAGHLPITVSPTLPRGRGIERGR